MKRILFIYFLFFGILKTQAQQVSQGAMDKLGTLITLIERYYVDSVKEKKLVEDALVGMLKELDPHSTYIAPEDLKEMNEPLEGNFEGIGVQFQIVNDTITVISPIAGGPSEKLGIEAGDKIIKVEDKTVAGVKIKNEDVMKLLRGKKGTVVNVAILKSNSKQIVEYPIVRDKIPIYSVDARYMIDKETGYIKVSRFAQTTFDEFQESLKQLKAKGMKNLILDLQDNGGGFLHIAIKMADEFLSDKKLIVYTKGISSPEEKNLATGKGDFEKGKLVILVNEGSASASEIVSGAVQDWDRGLIIGRRTFGKGLVQRPFNLPDGSMVRLTTARYYTPVGRSIQRPYEGGTEEYYKDLYNRFKQGELTNKDSIHFPDSLKFHTPAKRDVYGGGGIMPDIFIPIDTTRNSSYLIELSRKGAINQFVVKYIDTERKNILTRFPDFESFKAGYEKIEKDFNSLFLAYCEKEKIKFDENGYNLSKSIIQLQLKALLARNLYTNDAFFEVYNVINQSYNKAVEVIRDDTYFKKQKINY
jgi:carboxyl-terminal processing protease